MIYIGYKTKNPRVSKNKIITLINKHNTNNE
jgi:hypothetical protein